uniref:DUF4116 domain-containing protein n=1 Tax=viral metagenome TaxID=1070528 RepID=A0A6C0EBZ1_9ZZZZ
MGTSISLELDCLYNGEEFNKLTKPLTFWKVMNDKECHFGFQYKDGLNIDTHQFNGTDKYGLYFVDLEYLPKYMFKGQIIRRVAIPDDANVYALDECFKADKIILCEKFDIKNFPYWHLNDFCLNAVKKNGLLLSYVINKTDEQIKEAVKQNGNALLFVKKSKQNYELCKTAITTTGNAIRFSKFVNDDLLNIAVNNNPFILPQLEKKEQTEKVCESACRKNRYLIEYIKSNKMRRRIENKLGNQHL